MEIMKIAKFLAQELASTLTSRKKYKGKIVAEFDCINGSIGKVSIQEKRDFNVKDIDNELEID